MAGRDWWTTGLPGSDALVREGGFEPGATHARSV
jgi:hypothetical protein